MFDFIDTTTDYVLVLALAISALIALKVFLERQAIWRSGRTPTSAGNLWLPLTVVLAVILLVVNR